MMQSRGLAVIVTGMEHSGTTYLSQLIAANSSSLAGGFECGVLLSPNSPREFNSVKPFYDWLCHPIESGHWGLTAEARERVCDTEVWMEVYERLVEECSLFDQKRNQVIDKTPAYCYNLKSVMTRADQTPVIIIEKNLYSLFASHKRRGQSIVGFLKRHQRYLDSLHTAESEQSRILKISHDSLITEPQACLDRIFAHIDIAREEIPDHLNRCLNWKALPISEDYSVQRELAEARQLIDGEEKERLEERIALTSDSYTL